MCNYNLRFFEYQKIRRNDDIAMMYLRLCTNGNEAKERKVTITVCFVHDGTLSIELRGKQKPA